MPKKRPRVLRGKRQLTGELQIVNPHAAGIDVGAEQHWVSVPEGRDAQPVQMFGTFTADLERLADWLAVCGVTTVALEATGVYWIPLYEMLDQRGLQPRLVDSRSVGGRRRQKTDVLDCQWIRKLHTHGLLNAAFRPSNAFVELRSYQRQRKMLSECAADYIRRMQKALDLMNVKLHLVLSDITGVTGMRIIEAILAGKTQPEQLAELRDRGCKNSKAVFVEALKGNYRAEHVFALAQALDLYRIHLEKIAECDKRIQDTLNALEPKADASTLKPVATRGKRRKNQLHFDARNVLYGVAGVDLTAIPGLEAPSVLTILSETGTDLSAWENGEHFAAWLNLTSTRWVTGGKPIRVKAPKIRPNRAAQTLRLAAQTLERSKHTYLGAFFRRIRSRIGRPGAIKATAHKLALIIYAMLKNQTEYEEHGADYYERRFTARRFNSLKRQAATLGYELTPVTVVH